MLDPYLPATLKCIMGENIEFENYNITDSDDQHHHRHGNHHHHSHHDHSANTADSRNHEHLDVDEYRSWFDAIMANDVDTVQDILNNAAP